MKKPPSDPFYRPCNIAPVKIISSAHKLLIPYSAVKNFRILICSTDQVTFFLNKKLTPLIHPVVFFLYQPTLLLLSYERCFVARWILQHYKYQAKNYFNKSIISMFLALSLPLKHTHTHCLFLLLLSLSLSLSLLSLSLSLYPSPSLSLSVFIFLPLALSFSLSLYFSLSLSLKDSHSFDQRSLSLSFFVTLSKRPPLMLLLSCVSRVSSLGP